MSAIDKEQINNLISQYTDNYLHTDLISAKAVKNIQLSDNKITIEIVLGYPAAGHKDELTAALTQILNTALPNYETAINVSWKIETHTVQPGIQTIIGIKNIIAVASGKGGVGKSTTTVNLALAMLAEGAKVGILDADIYGPNQPQMLGVYTRPQVQDNKRLLPVMQHGIQSMSIGYLVDANAPMIWRGPMVSTALQQLLRDTAWDNLDYLFIDLPPGTGDIQLTLAQKIPVSGAIIITTPQDIALLDARKGLEMFRKVKVSILGVIENMSMHICSHCGHQEDIFGTGGGEKLARDCDIELLGQLPLDKSIREHADHGHPTVVVNPEGSIAKQYRNIACKVAAKLSLQSKNYAAKFPKIVVE